MEPSVEYINAVSNVLRETRNYLDGLGLIPRKSSRPDAVLLALLSKSVVLGESLVLLVSRGFYDEAFGLCRTLLELELTVRYLTNADTVARCARYVEYFAKVNQKWLQLAAKYYPGVNLGVRTDAAVLTEVAKEYPSANRWAEDELKNFASEPDSFEMKEDGTPLDESFYYEVLYKWMSYYAHVTEHALDPSHITLPGDSFKVHRGIGRSTRGDDALRLSYRFVYVTLLRVLRFLNMTIPSDLQGVFDRTNTEYAKSQT